ncbi:MAG TPA: FecR family protein, partial [Magnetospirillaceae bacterium]|nr:FecR family protein [Magnetospirillaceae bacterium]
MSLRKLPALILVVLAPSMVFAQVRPALFLEFVSGTEFTVLTAAGVTLAYPSGIAEEDEIPPGSIVRTGAGTTAELRLRPNGSIVKLARGTSFRVDAVARRPEQTNQLALIGGKIRAVAARGGNFEIRTSTTVAGVRGTDFTLSYVEGARNFLLVSRGSVQFARLGVDGRVLESIMVGAGQFADLFGPAFRAIPFTAEQFAAEYGDVEIAPERLLTVPGQEMDAAAEDDDREEARAEPAEESPFARWLKDALGFELGSI